MPYWNVSARLLLVCLFALVSSCGGGGETPDPITPTPDTTTATITGTPKSSVNEIETYSFSVSTSGFTNTSLVYSIENKPDWANFDSTTGELSGTPSYDDAGVYEDIKVSASDGTNSESLPSFSIIVADVNRSPTLNSSKTYTFDTDKGLSALLDIADQDHDFVTVTFNDLPNWLEFFSENNLLEGSPSSGEVGQFTIEVVMDDGKSIVIETIKITVEPEPEPEPEPELEPDDKSAAWFKEKEINLITTSDSGLLFFYVNGEQLVTFDSELETIVNIQSIDGVSELTYHNRQQQLYIGMSDGDVYTLSEEYVLNEFSIGLRGGVSNLTEAEDFLVTTKVWGSFYDIYVYDSEESIESSTVIVAEIASSIFWEPIKRRLYQIGSDSPVMNIFYQGLDENGSLSKAPISIDYPESSLEGPIIASPDGEKILLANGGVYNTESLTLISTISEEYDQAIWLADGSILLITNNSTATRVQRLSAALEVIETSSISGKLIFAEERESDILIVTQDDSGINLHSYLINDDFDNDSVHYTVDAFPLDSAASIDSDLDGFPDSWNAGYSSEDSTTNLSIDFFPLDNACWSSEHAVEANSLVCDYKATMPVFIPAQSINDDKGNIYLLNEDNNTVYRWSAETKEYSNLIYLDKNKVVSSIAHSSSHNRLYVLYENVSINYIDLSTWESEKVFLADTDIDSTYVAGDFLIVVNDNENRKIYNVDGEMLDIYYINAGELYSFVFDESSDIAYFNIGENSLVSQSISAEGELGDTSYGYHDAISNSVLRLSPDSSMILSTSGYSFLTTNLDDTEQVLPSAVKDLRYFDNVIMTIDIGDITDSTAIKFYFPDSYLFLGEATVSGAPIALFSHEDEAQLITFDATSGVQITSIDLADADGDTFSNYVETDVLGSDPLLVDSDADGLPDFYEWQNQLLINSNDADEDADNDGLTNIDEFTLGSGVNNSDSDSDGLTDGDEVNIHLTSPFNKDSDEDGMPDGWEVTNTLNPLDSADALLDNDNDSYHNFEEYYLGSNPLDGNDMPERLVWNSFQGGADNAGFVATYIKPENLSLRWSVTPPDASYGKASVVENQGKVITTYSSSYNRIAASLSSVDGSVEWQVLYGDTYAINSPSFAGNKVYLQAGGWNDSHLYALNIEDGSEVFASSYDNHYLTHEAPTIFDNDIYISAGSGVHKYDGETGEEIWFTSFAYCEKWTPAVNENSVYFYRGALNVLNKDTGEITHTSTQTDNYDCRTPVLGKNSNAFVISDEGLTAFNSTTAEILWQVPNESNYKEFTETPVVGGGKVYSIYSDELKVFDEFTGEELWSWETGYAGGISNNIILTMNLVFVTGSAGTYAIDLTTHLPVWNYDVSGYLSLSQDGALYIQSYNGKVTAINIYGDSDNDGIDDWWENFYGLDADDGSDATINFDGDDLTNLEEFNLGTNPLLNDSDGDGIGDSDEVSVYLSDPTKPDTDDDGMPDLWEVNQGFNLLDGEDAILDSDNDGATNVDEYLEETDPNDGSSIPVALPNQNFSFEDNVIPADFIADDTMPSVWEPSSVESSLGDFSLYSSEESAFELTQYFQGTRLRYSAKSTCNNSYSKVYIDGDEQSSTGKLSTEWQVFELLIPKGRHTLRLESSGCSIYIDDMSFELLENITSTNTFFATTNGEMLNIFNLAGDLVRQVNIPEAEDSAWWAYRERDLTILEDGRVAIFNGTYNPSLSIYSPESNLWSHLSAVNWSTDLNLEAVGDSQSGGIASNANTVFVTSMSAYDNHFGGIISFNLNDGSITKTKGKEYIDLTIGLDGFLYAMTENVIDKYNTENMALLMSYPISKARSIAVDSQGNMYTASWFGIVTRYNLLGQETKSIDTTQTGNSYVDDLFDIDINYDGQLFIGNYVGQLLITDTSLTDVSFYQDSSDRGKGRFLSVLLTEADNDSDGMPGWWESLHGLSDDDKSDALTDLESDSVNNLAEYNAKSDPLKVDTDEDGLDDFAEIYDSLTSAILADSDNDGLSDINEINLHFTNPNDADSDGDLVNDGDEVNIYKTDPLDAAVVPIIDIVDFNDGIIPAEFTQIPSAGGEWLIEHNSLRSAKTPYGSASESSAINYSKSFSEGTLTFGAILKEDYCCGSLIVIVDGLLILGESQSGTFSLDVDEDTKNIEFRYNAEELNSSDYNGVWIDNILFTPSH